MMYNNKLAMAIKVNGQVLRETGSSKDEVFLPFGSEYSILLKNLETVRVQASIFIDGKDIGDGTKFVVEPNSEIELERFLPNGNKSRGNRFKFIERTDAVEQHRGIKIDDGLVRVEYQFEQKVHNEYVTRTHYYDDWKPRPWPTIPYPVNPWPKGPYYPEVWFGSVGGSDSLLNNGISCNYMATSACLGGGTSSCTSFGETLDNDVGITAPGSISEQSFYTVNSFALNATQYTMVIKLRGQKTGSTAKVVHPVTVKHKPKCTMCGITNQPWARFCSQCGSSVELVD